MNAPLRVFVSSTSKDLHHFRRAVLDEVGRQEWLSVAMENFGATPHPAVEECLRRVRSSDLMILLVARKRSWVPTSEQGGVRSCQLSVVSQQPLLLTTDN